MVINKAYWFDFYNKKSSFQDFHYIMEPHGIDVKGLKVASWRFYYHLLAVVRKCIEYCIGKFWIHIPKFCKVKIACF